jgi:hypothetical protein
LNFWFSVAVFFVLSRALGLRVFAVVVMTTAPSTRKRRGDGGALAMPPNGDRGAVYEKTVRTMCAESETCNAFVRRRDSREYAIVLRFFIRSECKDSL